MKSRTADEAMHCKTFKGREDVIVLRGRRKDKITVEKGHLADGH